MWSYSTSQEICTPFVLGCSFFVVEYWLIFNSLALGNFAWNLGQVIFKQILVIDGWGISCNIALIWMSLDFTDDQSTLVQVMAWCRQATSHYLSQCWPRSQSPYGVTRPQWVNHILQDYFTGTGAIIWTAKWKSAQRAQTCQNSTKVSWKTLKHW